MGGVVAHADAENIAARGQSDGDRVLGTLCIKGLLVPRISYYLAAARHGWRLRTEADHEQRVATLALEPHGELRTLGGGRPQRTPDPAPDPEDACPPPRR